jgi:hypothetical protein
MNHLLKLLSLLLGLVVLVTFLVFMIASIAYFFEANKYEKLSSIYGYDHRCIYPHGCLIKSPRGWVDAKVLTLNKAEVELTKNNGQQ